MLKQLVVVAVETLSGLLVMGMTWRSLSLSLAGLSLYPSSSRVVWCCLVISQNSWPAMACEFESETSHNEYKRSGVWSFFDVRDCRGEGMVIQ
jgi:hypothetical protein